jgi:hypothetical protein
MKDDEERGCLEIIPVIILSIYFMPVIFELISRNGQLWIEIFDRIH